VVAQDDRIRIAVAARPRIPVRSKRQRTSGGTMRMMSPGFGRHLGALVVVLAANIVFMSTAQSDGSCNWELSDRGRGKQVQLDLWEIFQDDTKYLEELRGKVPSPLTDGVIGKDTRYWLNKDHLCDASRLFRKDNPIEGLRQFAEASAKHCGWRSTLMSDDFWVWRKGRPNDNTKIENPVTVGKVEEQLIEYWNRKSNPRTGDLVSYFQVTAEDLTQLESWTTAEKALCDLRQKSFTSKDDAKNKIIEIVAELQPAGHTGALDLVIEKELGEAFKKFYGLSERAKAFLLVALEKTETVDPPKFPVPGCDAMLSNFALLEMTDKERMKSMLSERLEACVSRLWPKDYSDAAALIRAAEDQLQTLFDVRRGRLKDVFYSRLKRNQNFVAVASGIRPKTLKQLEKVNGIAYPTAGAFRQAVDLERISKRPGEKSESDESLREERARAREWRIVRALAIKTIKQEEFEHKLSRLQAGDAVTCKPEKIPKVENFAPPDDMRYVFYPFPLGFPSDAKPSLKQQRANVKSGDKGSVMSWAIDLTGISRIGFWGLSFDKGGTVRPFAGVDNEILREAAGLALDYDVGVDLILYQNSWKEILAEVESGSSDRVEDVAARAKTGEENRSSNLADKVAGNAIRAAKKLMDEWTKRAAHSGLPSSISRKPKIGLTVFFENFPQDIGIHKDNKDVKIFKRFFRDLVMGIINKAEDDEEFKYRLNVVIPKDMMIGKETSKKAHEERKSRYGFLANWIKRATESSIELGILVFLAGDRQDAGADALAHGLRDQVRDIDSTPGNDNAPLGAAGDCYAEGLSCQAVLDHVVPVFVLDANGVGDEDKWNVRIDTASYNFGGFGFWVNPNMDDKTSGDASSIYKRAKQRYGACDNSLFELCSKLVLPNQKWLFLLLDLLVALILIAGGIRFFTCWIEPYRKEFVGTMVSLAGASAFVGVLLTCLTSDLSPPKALMAILIIITFLVVLIGGGYAKFGKKMLGNK